MSKKNTINEARKPADRTVGRHLLKGLRYDSNGNPLYTCDTLSNEEAQAIGWKFSPKYGLYGQFPYVSDPTMFYESKNMSKKNTIRLTESELKRVISESVKKVLMENDDFQPHGYRGTSNWGGLEMQISDSGDAARLRNSVTNQVSDWLEIQFDENGVAYVTDENGHEERLCDYMRY